MASARLSKAKPGGLRGVVIRMGWKTTCRLLLALSNQNNSDLAADILQSKILCPSVWAEAWAVSNLCPMLMGCCYPALRWDCDELVAEIDERVYRVPRVRYEVVVRARATTFFKLSLCVATSQVMAYQHLWQAYWATRLKRNRSRSKSLSCHQARHSAAP